MTQDFTKHLSGDQKETIGPQRSQNRSYCHVPAGPRAARLLSRKASWETVRTERPLPDRATDGDAGARDGRARGGKSPSQLTLQLRNYTLTETKRRPSHATTINIFTILMVRESNTVESLALK